jgi:hypothetical protein
MAREDGVFLLVGEYASTDDAKADYEIVKDLHAAGQGDVGPGRLR